MLRVVNLCRASRRVSLALRVVHLWRASRRVSLLFGCSQVFAEGFLRFDVVIAEAFVERVRAIADYVRTQSDGAAAFFPRPALGTSQKMHSNSLRAVALVNHQAADLG